MKKRNKILILLVMVVASIHSVIILREMWYGYCLAGSITGEYCIEQFNDPSFNIKTFIVPVLLFFAVFYIIAIREKKKPKQIITHCMFCGAEIPPNIPLDSKFCLKCGKKLV